MQVQHPQQKRASGQRVQEQKLGLGRLLELGLLLLRQHRILPWPVVIHQYLKYYSKCILGSPRGNGAKGRNRKGDLHQPCSSGSA